MKQLELTLSFEDISKMSKYKFKKVVKQACHKAAFNYLLVTKEQLSKGSEIHYENFKTQKYLTSGSGLSTIDLKQIYAIRSRATMCKSNFPSMFRNISCPREGCIENDTQYHLFYSNCFQKHSQNVIPSDIKYEDIFSNDVNKQLIVKQIFYQKYNDRDKYLSSIGRSITDQKIAKSSGSGAKDGNSIQ